MQSTINRLENALKSNHGLSIPEIRYWDGTECFSTSSGQWKSSTFIGSIELWLNYVEKSPLHSNLS